MNSPQVQSIVTQMVDWYADERAGLLSLNVDDIPDIHIDQLCAMILSQDDNLAAEVSGPDNPDWERYMLPALIQTLANNGSCTANEFNDIWHSGVRAYLKPMIERMIDEKLEFLNEDRECHTSLIWDRASEKTLEIASRI